MNQTGLPQPDDSSHRAPISPPIPSLDEIGQTGCTGDEHKQGMDQNREQGEPEQSVKVSDSLPLVNPLENGAPVYDSGAEPTEFERDLEKLRLKKIGLEMSSNVNSLGAKNPPEQEEEEEKTKSYWECHPCL